jgi:Predicted membrane protein (DUF2142)
MPSGRSDRAVNIIAAAICTIAIALAAGWALVLPIFLSPDEDSHYDYALTLFTAGRPMRAAENEVGRDTHPTVAYLMRATHARQQRLDEAAQADPGYGTGAYFRALDAGAPRVDAAAMRTGPIAPVPYISRLYPIGYYALAALAIALGDRVTHGSVVGQFFFARFLSVALLVSTLLFTWLALRELALGTRRALLFLACTALLPMTAWMSGYVQPDDLVCALVAPIVYVALRLRKRPNDVVALGVLGLLLAALMATKQQYFLAVYVPILAMLAVRAPYRWSAQSLRSLAWITIPALVAFAFTQSLLHAAPGGGGICKLPSQLEAARRLGPAHVIHYYANGITTTFDGSFLPSTGLESFWLAYTAYRNSLIVLGAPDITRVVAALLAPVSLIVALLFCIRVFGVARRLLAVAHRRSWRSAARVATSNVLVNSYLCYFAILLGFEISTGGYIPIQGRYWLPFVSAVWIVAVAIAPRALPRRFARAMSAILLTLILGFDVAASAFTFPSLHERFYGPVRKVAAASELLADVTPRTRGDAIQFSGAAMDLRDAAPATRVVVRLDDRIDLPARRVARPDIECNMEETLLQSGFEASIPAAKLAAGPHTVAVFVTTPWSQGLVDSGAHASFQEP